MPWSCAASGSVGRTRVPRAPRALTSVEPIIETQRLVALAREASRGFERLVALARFVRTPRHSRGRPLRLLPLALTLVDVAATHLVARAPRGLASTIAGRASSRAAAEW